MSPLLKAASKCPEANLEQLTSLTQAATLSGDSPVDELLDKGGLAEGTFLPNLASEIGWSFVELPQPDLDMAGSLKKACPARLALRYRLLPISYVYDPPRPASTDAVDAIPPDDTDDVDAVPAAIQIGCYDPFNLLARQAAARSIPYPIRWKLAPRSEILRGIQEFYGVGADTFEDLLKNREFDIEEAHLRDEANIIDADDADASVVKFVNQIIREALAQRATDIHLEPVQDNLRIRYRIDGVLHEAPVPENIRALQSSVLARVKVMAKLDIAEKRLPQDGRINLKLENQSIDVRVATIPSVEGESISLRLLGQERFTLDRLGLSAEYRDKIIQLLARPNGIVLVTGPTGSGKSTTLYTFLSQLNHVHRRIVTIEDPVEHKLSGVVQIAVKPEINLTFANGLRSILRGDPNVVMVGEIRDLETAEIAVRASLTGHLVFSTLHTNDAIGGITRLVEMGVEPFLIGSSVRAFLAQRLVRTLCPKCKQPAEYTPEQLAACGFPRKYDGTICTANPGGCQSCRGTGYHGRLAIYEIAMMTPGLQDLVVKKSGSNDLLRQARKDGFISMRDYGWRKVIDGTTTLEEVMRVTSEDFLE